MAGAFPVSVLIVLVAEAVQLTIDKAAHPLAQTFGLFGLPVVFVPRAHFNLRR